MSSSFWWDSANFNNTVVGKQPLPDQSTVFYVDSGDSSQSGCAPPQNCDDRLQTINVRDVRDEQLEASLLQQFLLQHLGQLGWTLNENLYYYLEKGGVHNEASWG